MTDNRRRISVEMKNHPPSNTGGRRDLLRTIGGSVFDDWNNTLANQVLTTLWFKNSDAEAQEKQVNAVFGALIGIAPADELEGMMAAQLLAAHNAAMECYRRAMIPDQTFDGRRESLNQANKLSRTWATLLEALNKHRGKGQQKVTVEHVHVHSGGQAVVGMVASGGGGESKSEERPHAKQFAHAQESALPSPCSDEGRNSVQVSGDEERQVSNARRTINGSAERE